MRLGTDISCILQCAPRKICISNQSLLRKPRTVRLDAVPLASWACLPVSCEGKCASGQHLHPAPSGKWVEVMVCCSCRGPLLCRLKSSAAMATANHSPQTSAYSIRNQFHATQSHRGLLCASRFPERILPLLELRE